MEKQKTIGKNASVLARRGENFLPMTREEMAARGWDEPDFVYVSGDAYVDHPSFGVAIISRVLEDAGFRVAILAQPDFSSCEDFKRFGRPRLGFLVTAGNIDSMVAHYTVAGKRRTYDYYSPGGKMGKRPDRAIIVYCNRIREAFGDVPIVLGGLEASLRRFAHYDYWQNKVRRSVLVDSRADLLTYGMGENILVRVAKLLDRGIPIRKIRDVRGTCYMADPQDPVHFPVAAVFDYETMKNDKAAYAAAFGVQYKNQDAVSGGALVEKYDNRVLVQNPPMPPLETAELDHVYSLPYMRTYPPCYEKEGGVPAIAEVKFSVTHNRGCFGGCNFCALAFHQGRSVRARSEESVVREVELLTEMPDFKGYIHDVGGPTANFRGPACDKQLEHGVCATRKCLFPKPCPNLKADHTEYIKLLEAIESVQGVKKVFIRSGIRFDYMLADKSDAFFRKLVRDHVSGQLKVAPEHCAPNALMMMGKPPVEVYDKFREKYAKLSEECGKQQYIVPYLMSSHPGCTMDDAARLALYTKKIGLAPEQVQDFYPTPGTPSTVMYYTGIDPMTGKSVYVTTDYHEKQLQRALLQWRRPENRRLIREAMEYCTDEGRRDLCELLGQQSGTQNGQKRTNGQGSEKTDGRSGNRGGKSTAKLDYQTGRNPQSKTERTFAKKPTDKTNSSETKKPKVDRTGWAKAKPKKNAKPHSKKKLPKVK